MQYKLLGFMHQIVRQVVLDYAEDYANGTLVITRVDSEFDLTKDYAQAILHRNQRIEQFQQYGLEQTLFQKLNLKTILLRY